MISGLTYTVRTTGFLSLYRGLAPTLIGSVPKAGIRFGLNAVIKERLRSKTDGTLTPAKQFLAGLGAGVSEALIIVAPVETVKTKCIELDQPFVKGLKHIIHTEGVGGVYKGAVATALKQGSNQGLRFMWFNEYKAIVTNHGEKPMTPLLGLFGGMSAGCFSTLGNNPFDVVKVSDCVCSIGCRVMSRFHREKSDDALLRAPATNLILAFDCLPLVFLFFCGEDSYARHKGEPLCKYSRLFQTNSGQRRSGSILCRSGSSVGPRRARTRHYLYEL